MTEVKVKVRALCGKRPRGHGNGVCANRSLSGVSLVSGLMVNRTFTEDLFMVGSL